MTDNNSLSRRQFVAAASAGLVLADTAGAVAAEAENKPATAEPASKLAIEGGEKAVKTPAGSRAGVGASPNAASSRRCSSRTRSSIGKGRKPGCLTERFQTICPLKYVQTCSSGTAALHIAVGAAGIGLGDEVITSPVTDIGTVIGVLYQQGVPVFADLGRGTYNLDVADVQRRITPRTKAIIAVHLTGNPCDLDALKELADRHKLVLIEDCARRGARAIAASPSAPWGTSPASRCRTPSTSPAATAAWSPAATSASASCLQRFGDKGGDRHNWGGVPVFATNYRMSEPQAAVAAAQLPRLEVDRLATRPAGQPAHGENRQAARHHSARGTPRRPRRLLVLHVPHRPPHVPLGRAEFVRALLAERRR